MAIAKFKGLNSNSNSGIIDPSEAQDALNVEISPTGNSVKKRLGYGIYKTLPTSKALHGGYHSFDSSGNDYQLWGSSTSLYGIVQDATPTQLISSATINSTWDCVDSQGNSYCVNSNRDMFLQTNGTTKTWYPAPLGTMVAATPDRIVVAGVAVAPNSLYVSQSNTFTNFTVGLNPTDPFVEPISSPGSKLTHITWGCGKLLWWKDQSMGYFDFDDQFVAQVKTVSDTIGTFDNTSAIDPGGSVWFRGQNGHTYKYDCSSLEKMSIDITPNVQVSGSRTANLWTQTTQSDWQAGTSTPSINFSTTYSAGDVTISSFNATDTLAADFSLFTSSSNVSINAGNVQISTNNSGTATNPSFESSLVGSWVETGSIGSMFNSLTTVAGIITINPQSGSNFLTVTKAADNIVLSGRLEVVDLSGNILAFSSSVSGSNNPWAKYTVTVSASDVGKRVRFRFLENTWSEYLTTAGSYILGGNISVYMASTYVIVGPDQRYYVAFDNIENGSSTITTGSFTSRQFDTAMLGTLVLGQANWTANTSVPYVEFQHSTNGSTWAKLTSSTGTNNSGNRYIRYISSFTVGATENALSTLDDVSVVVKSTGGTFVSQVKNAPSINGWSTFSANAQTSGGTHTFYIRSATNTITITNSTPTWVAQSNGGLVSASTGTYFQIRDDFATTTASNTLSLNDFTINWFEGSATDQSYMIYFEDAIWQSVAYGDGQSTNNYIFKYDLINQGWTLFNIVTGGMLIQRNILYFGDTSTGGNVFNYGTVKSDNGTAINAYWKTKDFTGSDPFLQNAISRIEVIAKKDQDSILTATYTMDTSSSTSYSIILSSSNAIVQSRKNIPSGKLGYLFNYQIGDTSTTSAWEVLGLRITFSPQPWRPN